MMIAESGEMPEEQEMEMKQVGDQSEGVLTTSHFQNVQNSQMQERIKSSGSWSV